MNWFRKILGDKANKLPEEVDSAWAQRIEAFLAPLNHLPEGKGRSGVAQDIFAYVLHGEPQGILQEVSANSTIGKHLKFFDSDDESAVVALYTGFSSLPADLGLRWAYLLEAIIRGEERHKFYFQSTKSIAWAEVLILHLSGFRYYIHAKLTPRTPDFSLEYLDRLLVESGLPAETFLVSAFATPVWPKHWTETILQIVSSFDDFSQALHRHAESIRPLLLTPEVHQRLHVLTMLEKGTDDLLAEFAPQLCELAVTSSKQVRSVAEPLIVRCGAAAIKPLRKIGGEGKPDQRLHALRLLWRMADQLTDAPLRALVRETVRADKAASVQGLNAEWDAALQAKEVSGEQYDYPRPLIDWSGPSWADLSPMFDRFRSELDAMITSVNNDHLARHQQCLAKGYESSLDEIPDHPESLYESLRDYLVADKATWLVDEAYRTNRWYAEKIIEKIADDPAMTPVILMKMLHFFNIHLTIDSADNLNRLHRATGRPTLLEVQVMLEELGYPDPAPRMLDFYCHNSRFWTALADDWRAETVWSFFAHNCELLLTRVAEPQTGSCLSDRSRLFQAIATLPTPPAQIVNTLFTLALGPGKSDRPLAQAALEKEPGKEERIVTALTDGKAETRCVAAQWLGRLRHTPAIPALEEALGKEKNDNVKGALLDALQRLGQPVTKYLDRQALMAEATGGLAKGLPKELEGFPWGELPVVRWADSGEGVADVALRWMIVQAVRQKTPEPGAVLQKYSSMFHPRDRENFGQFILETWLRQDTAPLPAEAAEPLAASQAQELYDKMRNYPYSYRDDPRANRSLEELKVLSFAAIMRQPIGSAIASKGLLAVAGACAAERAPSLVKRYLKDFYGTRAAQGKALIAMLAWIEHPSATQLLLAISNRFRPKGFQEEASRQVELLAERKGWSVEELADRTIPGGGFDEQCVLELNYGPRTFNARLLPDLKIELFTPEGKKIAALPEPRSGDDTELARDAKKDLVAARKEIKTTVAQQSERLYEALCTEREWPFVDWNLSLNRHPLMRRLLQRLVWVQIKEEQILASFRPLEDGTLTDVEDNELHLPDEARIRLAHDSLLSADMVKLWRQHLIDYEVTPLFQQLGKGIYTLPVERRHADSLDDCTGHLLDYLALRSRAEKLGYLQGPAGDGGWITSFEKRFPALGLTAVLDFSGSPPVRESHTVALRQLSFIRGDHNGWRRSCIALAKIPPILLSEAYNDLRLIAAEGTGFDPEWRQKVEY